MSTRQTKTAESTAWSYTAGEWGRNRVRVYERGSAIWIDYTAADGKRERHSLSHADRSRAKHEADEVAARFGRAETRSPAVITTSRLFDIYEKEITPKKSKGVQQHDKTTLAMFRAAFGQNRRVETLNVRDWNSYIDRRRRGEIAPPGREGKKVRNRIIESDLKLLLAILNFAVQARDVSGAYLLDRNPLKGLTIPKEEAPRRPVLSSEKFVEVRRAATKHSLAAEMFVTLLWYTGHRAASVRQLRWTDVDLEARTIEWRAESDKIGFQHKNPLHAEAVEVLGRGKVIADETGDVWIFPCPRGSEGPMTRDDAADLWRAIADAVGIKEGSRVGTHSFRRSFANRLRDVPLKELQTLGGWKTEQTVVAVYIQPDQDAQRAALERL